MVRPATRLAPRGVRMNRPGSRDGDPLNFVFGQDGAAPTSMHAEPQGVSDLQDFLAKSHRTPAMRLRCEPSPHTRLSPDALLLVCTADYCGQRTGMEHCVSEIR